MGDEPTAGPGVGAPDRGAVDDGAVGGGAIDDGAVDDAVEDAAAAALARARAVARNKGLRPGAPGSGGRRRRVSDPTYSGSGRDGRDPGLLGDTVDKLVAARGWEVDVSAGAVMGRWAHIVGPDIAAHATPVTFTDGVLTVRGDSTAWATQLRLMSSAMLARIETEVGEGVVTELRVVGPGAPSWSKGPRKSTGPGPRDTYG